MYFIGLMYRNGEGVDKDYELAIKWLEKAAELGNNSAAMYALGLIYDENEDYQDYELAIEWYEKAAELDDRAAMYALGLIYKNKED